MTNYIKIIAFLLVIFSFISCGDEEQNNPSGMRVNFRLELNGRDDKLKNLYSYEVYTSPRIDGEYVGVSGLLVFNYGIDNDFSPLLFAYDLCCPHEDNPMTKVTPNAQMKAVCGKCKSEYDLINAGIVISGPSKRRLWSYPVSKEYPYNGIFHIRN